MSLESVLSGTKETGNFIGDIFRNSWKVADVALKTLLFPFYLTGTAMFKKNKENEYIVNQSFLGTRWPSQKPLRTVWNVPWLFKEVGRVSAQTQEHDSEISIRTNEAYEGTVKIQYAYEVSDGKGASIYKWNAGLNQGLIEEVVKAKIFGKIGNDDLDNLNSEISVYAKEVLKELSIKNKKLNPVYALTGNVIKNIAIKAIDLDPVSQEIALNPEKEINKMETTRKTIFNYAETSQEVASKFGYKGKEKTEKAYEIFRTTFEIDNYQTMSENSGTVIVGSQIQNPLASLYGLSPQKKRSKTPPKTKK